MSFNHVSGDALVPAGSAPRVRGGDVADDEGFLSGEVLPGSGQSEGVEVGESGQICWGVVRMVHCRGLL